MQLLFKHSFDLIRFVKCFDRKQRKPKKAAKRRKVDLKHTQIFQTLTALLNLYFASTEVYFSNTIFFQICFIEFYSNYQWQELVEVYKELIGCELCKEKARMN